MSVTQLKLAENIHAPVEHASQKTELGVLPKDWAVTELQNCCGALITYGIVQCGPHVNNGVPYIRVSDMEARTLDPTGMLRTSPAIASKFARSTVVANDIVYALRGRIGDVCIVPKELSGANLTQGTARISPSKRISSAYLLWALRSPSVLKQSEEGAKGSTFREMTLAGLRKLLVPVPPSVAEQQAIAEALNDADELIESLERLITKKHAIKTGVMQKLLTGKRRLPGFKGEWSGKRLGDVATLYQPATISAKQFTASGYPVYGANGIVGYFNNANHRSWQVTVTCRGSTCGTVNRTVDECWITGNAMVLNCDDNPAIDKLFFFYALAAQNLSDCITGTGQPQIVRSPLAAFEVVLPPSKVEQEAIASILSDIDTELFSLEFKLTKVRQVKQGMMQELLTGRVRLV